MEERARERREKKRIMKGFMNMLQDVESVVDSHYRNFPWICIRRIQMYIHSKN